MTDDEQRGAASGPLDAAGAIAAASWPQDEPIDPREPTPADEATNALWRARLLGTDPGLRQIRRTFGRIPSPPRCKVCSAPFHGPGRIFTRLWLRGESPGHPLICNSCIGSLAKHPGGAEIEISIVFADVRGSTGLAERTSAAEFRGVLQRFYEVSAQAIDRNGGIVDKFLGDGVMALFIPVLTGEMHAGRALQAARELLGGASRLRVGGDILPVGAGLHTGIAFVGAVGSGDKLDFSALGDTVNVAARLGSVAAAGELLVSRAAWDATGLPLEGASFRELEVRGRATALEVIVERPSDVTATT